jgi:hypothetical protein
MRVRRFTSKKNTRELVYLCIIRNSIHRVLSIAILHGEMSDIHKVF